jgi:hypothetical protein
MRQVLRAATDQVLLRVISIRIVARHTVCHCVVCGCCLHRSIQVLVVGSSGRVCSARLFSGKAETDCSLLPRMHLYIHTCRTILAARVATPSAPFAL